MSIVTFPPLPEVQAEASLPWSEAPVHVVPALMPSLLPLLVCTPIAYGVPWPKMLRVSVAYV